MEDLPNSNSAPNSVVSGASPTATDPETLSPTEATAQPITKNSFPAPEAASFSTPWERTAPPAPAVTPVSQTSPVLPPTVAPEIPTSDGEPKQPGRFKALLSKRPIFLVSIALVVLIVVVSAFLGLKFFVLDRLTTFDLLPDDTRFYLSIAVKDNPQAKALKELIKKFPAGEKVVTNFDKQITDSLSSSNDPFADFLRLDRNDLFLTQISRPDQTDNSALSTNIISLSNLLSPAKATERLAKFEKDDTNVVRKISYQGQDILDIHLKEAAKSAQPASDTDYLYPTTKSKVKTPKPPTIFATALQQFIIAGPKEDDIKKITDLSKVKASLGLINDKKLKGLTTSEAHKTIAKNFPEQTFLKYYSNVPVTPSSGFLPIAGVNQSFLGVFGGNLTNPENGSNISENLVTGLTASVAGSGLKINSFELDTTKSKDQDAKNPFSLTDSLANQIPAKLNGMTPTFYAETRNMKQIVNDQIDLIKNLAENSDSRKQRDSFASTLKEWEQNKKDIKKSIGLDFDNDILPLFEGQSSVIFNAGGAKIAPEILILTEIKDKTKAENSLKKLSIPDYSATARDYQRQSDVRTIATGLEAYYTLALSKGSSSTYPSSLNALVPNYLVSIPKDPSTGADYAYAIASDGKSVTLSANLENGQKFVFDSETGAAGLKGVASTNQAKLTPKPTSYNGTNIYSLEIYSYKDLKINFYFTVTAKKVIFTVSTTDKSIKELIDFEAKAGTTLFKTQKWQDQFGAVGNKVSGFAFVEPIQFWGTVDWITSLDTTYANYLTKDTATAYKAYLETLSSIGTVVTKKKPVYITSTQVKISELSKDKKKAAEDAIGRLIDDKSIKGYDTVLGISTNKVQGKASLGDKVYHWLKGKFVP